MNKYENWILWSINDENMPNILENILDQAPKRGEQYEKELQKVFNTYVEVSVDNELEQYFEKQNLWDVISSFISQYQQELANWTPITLVMKSKIKQVEGRTETIWSVQVWNVITWKIWKCFCAHSLEIQKWKNRVDTYLTITQDSEKFWNYKILPWQVEYPWEWTMLNTWIVFTKDLTWGEFVKVMDE